MTRGKNGKICTQVFRMMNCEGYETLCISLSAVASILVWVRLLYFGEPLFQHVGVTMAIVRRMIVDISGYVACMFILLCGFAHCMSIIFRCDFFAEPFFL